MHAPLEYPPRVDGSKLRLELVLSDTLAHGGGRGHAAGDGLHEVVHVVSATPLHTRMISKE